MGVGSGVSVGVCNTSITVVGSGSFCRFALQDTTNTMIAITNSCLLYTSSGNVHLILRLLPAVAKIIVGDAVVGRFGLRLGGRPLRCV